MKAHLRTFWMATVLCTQSFAAHVYAQTPAAPPSNDAAPEPQTLHIPVLERKAEQGILRPVPLSVELPAELSFSAKRVLVHYRLWGNPDWTTIELRRRGEKHEGAIPCLEVSTVTGDLRYYVRVHDERGRVIATAGSLARPFIVAIKHETQLAEEGKTASHAAKCPDPADCPRGLPGCPSEEVIAIRCETDGDCVNGMTCGFTGYCERTTRRLSWISLGISQEFGVISTTGICSTYPQENDGIACYRSDGVQYNGNQVLTNEPPAGGIGQTRIVVGFEQLVSNNARIGVRIAGAFAGSGPTPRNGTGFFPLLLSARASYFFGDDPFGKRRIRPFAALFAGGGMVDIHTYAHVREDPSRPALQGRNDLHQRLEVYKRAGDGFVGGAIGAQWALRGGFVITGELSVMQLFPFSAFVMTPQIGAELGL